MWPYNIKCTTAHSLASLLPFTYVSLSFCGATKGAGSFTLTGSLTLLPPGMVLAFETLFNSI